MENEYLFNVGTYGVIKLSDEERATEGVDDKGNNALLEQPLNYAIYNIETDCTEARSPFLPAAIQIAKDLNDKLTVARESSVEKKVPSLVGIH